jgi:hypothetical protein
VCRDLPYPVSCYTFGSPRVGNSYFAREFDAGVPDSWRIRNKLDVVTSVPTGTVFNYAHVNSEVTICDRGKMRVPDGMQISMFGGDALDDAVRITPDPCTILTNCC